jgi:hypothetical protein
MAILFAADCDNLGASGANIEAELANAGFHSAGTCNQETTIVRTGRGSIQLGVGDRLRYRSPGDQATLGCGFGLYVDSPTAAVEELFYFEYNSGAGHTEQIIVERDTNNALVVRNGDSTLLATSAINAITLQGWHFIECKVTCHATLGEVIIRVDDDEKINVSGVDTINGAAAAICNQIKWDWVSQPKYLDDVVVWDTTGSVNNDFLGGETRCYGLDVSGAGDSAQWTFNGAASNHEAVDEVVPNGDTDYNSSNSSGDLDLFHIDNLPAGITSVYAVQIIAQARREAGGTADIKLAAKLGGTTAYSGNINLDTTYKRKNWVMETKPGGGSYTPTDVDNLQAGYELV